ncbi:MAG TPA: carboxypeptidase M32 [Chitinophagaceae bacterium]|nr:carboxypeptidase M32 [Chitinophagaceae bacterium]
MNNNYRTYIEKMQQIADIRNAAAVLNWDEETNLPEKGAAFRGKQLATLSTLAHDCFADKELGTLLQKLSTDTTLNEVQKRNISKTLEYYQKNKKYSSKFVHQLSVASSRSYHAWIKARKENNFSLYQPALEKMISLKQQEAEFLGYTSHPYDALLDDFEKGATVKMLDRLFDQVKTGLQPFIDKILSQLPLDNRLLHQHFDKNMQWEFSLSLLQAMGFDFKAGRQDLSEHPFTTSFNAQDVRVTTRIDENDFAFITWSSIHEGGHALYEQGLPADQYGLPAGEATSLSIHESQSRLWENNIGRGRSFWKYFYPQLQKRFPEQLKDNTLQAFYQSMNKIQTTPIRTESDELTYHFHILIRYEIEKGLLSGDISVHNLKEAWNAAYKKYLGIDIQDDKSGVLQDIHWCHGGFGYFPTYSLGSFYAAQFYQTAIQQIPDLEREIAQGNFDKILHWLRTNIHQYGSLYKSEELCKRVTGTTLDFNFFMNYAQKKYGEIYQL